MPWAATTRPGAYANESIQVLRELWTADDPAFAGRFFNFGGVKFSPKPLQPGGVPILVGGGSRAALVRCARLGDGWHPIGGSVAALKARIETLRELWAEHGRDAAEMRVVARCELDLVEVGSPDPSTPMVGSADQLIEAVAAYAEIGVSDLEL